MNMRIVEAKPRGVNVIGKFHESNTTLVKFDLTEYMADYGDLNIVLVHKRNGDDVAIPSTGFTVVDGIGEWIVSEDDTSFVGCGEAEVQFRDDNHCRKSATYTTMVLDSPSNGTYPQSNTLKSYADEIAKVGASVVSATVGYAAIQKLKQYTYEVWYDKIDYTGAFDYFKNNDGMTPAACSSIRNGSIYGRNYDLYYDNESTFVVHVPAIGNRYATTTVCGGFKKLTQDYVDSKTADRLYGVLPFQVLDGFNEHGVYANINVVPYDKDHEYAGPEEYDFEISANMLIRYILDYYDNATEAVEYIRDHVRVVMSKALRKIKYDVHFEVADAEHTYVIEFVDGETKVIEKNYMTNFHLFGVTTNDDGTVYTPATQDEEHDAVITNGVNEYGGGLERYNMIVSSYAECNTKAGMRSMLDALKYTNTYGTEEPIWYTEFVGGELKCNSPVEAFADIIEKAREEYASRTRENPTTWQTVHSTVYDMASGKMYLVTQEEDDEFEFKIEIDKSSVEIDDTTTSTEKVWSSNKTNAELENKVEKVDGKGLSTNDYTNEDKDKVDNSVRMEAGKGLSTNDYTTADKEKLDSIEEEANKTIVDTSLSDSSDNPVANRTIKAKLDDIDSSLSLVNQAKADKAALKEANRRIHLLEEAALGHLYTDESVTETSYQQTVPSGSLSNAVVGMWGGHSEVVEGEIVSADVADVEFENLPTLNPCFTSVQFGINKYIPYVAGEKFYCTSNARFVVHFYDSSFVQVNFFVANSGVTEFTPADIPSTAVYWRWRSYEPSADESVWRNAHCWTASHPYVKTHNYIPSSVLAQYPLRSAGSVYDSITYEPTTVDGVIVPKWKHHKKVGTVDLGTLTWSLNSTFGVWNAPVTGFHTVLNNNVPFNGLSKDYPVVAKNTIWKSEEKPVGIGLDTGGAYIYVYNGSTTDRPTGTLFYELATEVVTDITELMQNWDGILEVEEGGTVTFKQENDTIFAVPNTINYLVKTTQGGA